MNTFIIKGYIIFKMHLFNDKHNGAENFVEYTSIKCINLYRRTVFFLKDKTVKEMIAKFVLNSVLYHVGFSWIISSNKQIKYDIEENNHPDWLNKGP